MVGEGGSLHPPMDLDLSKYFSNATILSRQCHVAITEFLLFGSLSRYLRIFHNYKLPDFTFWKHNVPGVAPNSLSFCFCLSLSNLTNYKSAAFRSLTILNSATILSTNTADS